MMLASPFLEYPLTRCSRESFPRLRTPTDLTQNLDVLRLILARTRTFFAFEGDWPLFSGFARPATEDDGAHPLFYAQFWEDGEVVRSWAFRDLGFVGVLNISYRESSEDSLIFLDYIQAVYFGVSQERLLPPRADEKVLALIDRDKLLVPVIWRP